MNIPYYDGIAIQQYLQACGNAERSTMGPMLDAAELVYVRSAPQRVGDHLPSCCCPACSNPLDAQPSGAREVHVRDGIDEAALARMWAGRALRAVGQLEPRHERALVAWYGDDGQVWQGLQGPESARLLPLTDAGTELVQLARKTLPADAPLAPREVMRLVNLGGILPRRMRELRAAAVAQCEALRFAASATWNRVRERRW